MNAALPPSSPAHRVVVAALSFVAATIVTLALWDVVFHRVPFALYIAAVAFAAWRSGWRAGTTVGVAGVLAISVHQRFAADLLIPSLILLGVTVIVSLLTATRERALTALHESERQYRLMVENVRDYAMFMTDLDGNVTKWNAGAERLLGWREDEIVGRSASVIFTPEDVERRAHLTEMATATRDGHAADDRWHQRKDGGRFYANGMMMAVKDEAGRHLGFTKILRDETARRAAEAALRESGERLLEAERAGRAEAERASRMKDEFLATVSHELRTPLNAILGWSQILARSGRDDGDLSEGLRTIERNARAQAQIVNDLLDMSRIIGGQARLDVRRVDLAGVVREAVATVGPSAEARSIRFHTVLDPHAGPVSGDPARLQQVMWNLLSNAVKFTPKGGRVQVVLERVDSHVEVSVIDTGEGISPEFLPHVFERFRQADASSTRAHGGLGLGLSIVKQLVELHGGNVRARSAGVGRGATFTVSLPLTAVRAESGPDAGRPEAPAGAPDPGPLDRGVRIAGVKVLVVDDEPDARALVKRLLEDRDGQVITAASASEALHLVEDQRPDVLVCDIGMPGEDGYALIRRVRALRPENGGDLPAAALTAYARAEDRVKAVLAGFQMHLAKPVEPAELIATVASLAGRTTP